MADKVTLFGMWASPYVKRVELALKVKGIPYEYVEEDLQNKSPLLCKYNPIYKKVPVLVHNGIPIVESLIILEYIEETWKNVHPLLPEDPLRKAQARFWAGFLQQLFEAMTDVVKTEGGAQEKAKAVVLEKLLVIEEGLKQHFPGGKPVVTSENINYLDIVMSSVLSPYKLQEEVLQTKVINPEKTPLIYAWLNAINEVPAVKELIPPHEKVVAYLQFVRQNALKSAAN